MEVEGVEWGGEGVSVPCRRPSGAPGELCLHLAAHTPIDLARETRLLQLQPAGEVGIEGVARQAEGEQRVRIARPRAVGRAAAWLGARNAPIGALRERPPPKVSDVRLKAVAAHKVGVRTRDAVVARQLIHQADAAAAHSGGRLRRARLLCLRRRRRRPLRSRLRQLRSLRCPSLRLHPPLPLRLRLRCRRRRRILQNDSLLRRLLRSRCRLSSACRLLGHSPLHLQFSRVPPHLALR